MLFPMAMYGKADFSVFNLTCEQAKNPLGIETQQPRFSWQIRSSERNFVQSSYEVLVADSPEMIIKGMFGVVEKWIHKNQF